jgi:hypothetical protein
VNRLGKFASRFSSFESVDVFKEGIWSITDKVGHMGNEWYKLLKDFLKKEKLQNRKQYTFATPFVDKDGKPIYTIFPTFGQIDSITEFETSDIEEIQEKNQLGESGGNTIHMRSRWD